MYSANYFLRALTWGLLLEQSSYRVAALCDSVITNMAENVGQDLERHVEVLKRQFVSNSFSHTLYLPVTLLFIFEGGLVTLTTVDQSLLLIHKARINLTYPYLSKMK